MTAPELRPSRQYLSGFGNELASEAVAGALPAGRNSPQRAPHDLYTELLSGTAFTAPRAENRRTWLYRRQPSVMSGAYQLYAQDLWTTGAAGGKKGFCRNSIDGPNKAAMLIEYQKARL